MTYDDFFANAITRLHDERCHRVFANLERTSTCFPHALWDALDGPRKVIIWCSNDYLGMGQHPEVIKAMVETATRMGVGQGGAQYLGDQSSTGRTRAGTRRSARQGLGACLHLWLRLERNRHFDNCQADAELPHSVGCL